MEAMEVTLEKEVMGEDYDGLDMGKADWLPSHWMLEGG